MLSKESDLMRADLAVMHPIDNETVLVITDSTTQAEKAATLLGDWQRMCTLVFGLSKLPDEDLNAAAPTVSIIHIFGLTSIHVPFLAALLLGCAGIPAS